MTVQGKTTKQAIMDAAIELFNTKSYQGTTIRDIASRANVNAANISYYFQGKQGLLEKCLISFFDPYVACLEEEAGKLRIDHANVCLNRALKRIIQFQSENHLLARFIWREVSIDSQLTREVISSYMMKERFYFKKMIQILFQDKRMLFPMDLFIIQLKGMLMMPYLNSQYIREVWGIIPQERYFADKYLDAIQGWIDASISNAKEICHLSPVPIRHMI
ncbi:forespore capture DNA-binding protein RefZ [Bacillus sp. FSL K6-3431]|uniref:forespore capture DNA-binding protein RefZ n=1 Tax=Bacillus sp. FSL K6-3431 TaxID=2921500 RepID=UPI0030F69FB7